MKIILTLLVAASFLSCADSTSAQRAGDVPYDEATYEVSHDPGEVVLEVGTIVPLTWKGRSLTVYADGRVEMQSKAKGRRVIEERTTQLDERELRSLLNTAVHHGLFEWESSTITAWMRQSSPNLPVVADAVRVNVSLHLRSYQRGDYSVGPASRTLSTQSPERYTKWYPEIKQFQGVFRLVQWLDNHWVSLETEPGASAQ